MWASCADITHSITQLELVHRIYCAAFVDEVQKVIYTCVKKEIQAEVKGEVATMHRTSQRSQDIPTVDWLRTRYILFSEGSVKTWQTILDEVGLDSV